MKTIILNEYYFINLRMEENVYEKLVNLYENVFFKESTPKETVLTHMYKNLNNGITDLFENDMMFTYSDEKELIHDDLGYFRIGNENSKSYDDDIFLYWNIKHFEGENITIDIQNVSLGKKNQLIGGK